MDGFENQLNILLQNVSGWEQQALNRIGKRINRYGKMSVEELQAINNLADITQDMNAIAKDLEALTKYTAPEIEKMYADVINSQHWQNKPLYDYRGKKFLPFAENKELQALVRGFAKSSAGTMLNLSKTKAFKVRKANGDIMGFKSYYTNSLDKAIMQVSSGALDFHSAMRNTIEELGGSGVRVEYESGYVRRLTTAVRQNLMWGAKQTSVAYSEMLFDELGCNGYEIDYHSSPRPSHEFMQGKQYIVGKGKTINGVYFESFEKAEKALEDFGCLHYKTPIICGISEPRYTPQELEHLKQQDKVKHTIDGKEYTNYEATQEMRRIETAIRNATIDESFYKTSGYIDRANKETAKIVKLKKRYKEISDITGIPQDRNRMKVVLPNEATPKVKMPKKIFPKAKTVEEAEEYARTHIFSGSMLSKTSYKGIDVDIANGINETLSNLQEKYGFKLAGAEVVNPKTAKGLKALGGKADAPFATQSITGRVYINKEILKNPQALANYNKKGDEAFELVIANKDKLSPKMKALAETYERAGKSLVDDSLEGMITHEYGHFLNVQINPSAEVVEQLKRGMEKHTISGYSQHSVSEYLAECFVEYERGDRSKLDDVVIKIFEGAKK